MGHQTKPGPNPILYYLDLDGERIAEISALIKEKFSFFLVEFSLISNQTYSDQRILIAGHWFHDKLLIICCKFFPLVFPALYYLVGGVKVRFAQTLFVLEICLRKLKQLSVWRSCALLDIWTCLSWAVHWLILGWSVSAPFKTQNQNWCCCFDWIGQ